MNLREIEGMFDVGGEFVDIVKFGWGTSYVTNNLEKKIALYRSFETPVVCGGTLFEVVYARETHRRVQVVAPGASLLARRDLRRHARHPARPQARADRRLRARLHRALRGRLEGSRRRVRAVPVGRVDQGREGSRRLEGDHRGARGRHRRHLPQGRRHAHRPDRRDRARDRASPTSSSRRRRRRARRGSSSTSARTSISATSRPRKSIPLETLRLGLRGDTLKEVLLGSEPAPAG